MSYKQKTQVQHVVMIEKPEASKNKKDILNKV